MNKNLLLVPLVVLNLVLLGVMVFKSDEPVREVTPDTKVGAVSSPDLQSPYFSYGGVRHWAQSTDNLVQASTTICVLQSPAATSTLAFSSLKFTTAATSSQVITVGKGSTVYTISTTLGTSTVAANAKDTVLAATTTPVGDSTNGRRTLTDRIFQPNTYLIYQFTTANPYTAPAGRCEALWIEN